LAPVNVNDDDLASKVNTVTSIANTVNSTSASAAPATIQGSSKLTPVDVDADNLTSMIDTVDAPSDSSSDSSSYSYISEGPPDDIQEGSLDYHKDLFSGTYYVDPLDDMETEHPKEAPDPVTEDAAMPDYFTTPLLSVGDQQPQPPEEPTNLGLLGQAQAGGCNSPQLVLQDLPLLVPAIIPASATDTNPSLNEAPVPSTIPMPLHGDGTGNGRTTLPPPTHTTHTNTTPRVYHTWVSNSLYQTTLFPPGGQQAIHTSHTTTITQNIVPLTFPHEQTS